MPETTAVYEAAEAAHESGIHVVLHPEILGTLWGIPITNTLITSWVVLLVLVVIALALGRNPKLIPGRVQTTFEWLFGFVYDYVAETLESRELAHKFFPLLTTMFLFIFTSNLLEFLPGVGSVLYRGEPLFRSVNTDLNVTLMLAIMAFLVVEITGIVMIGVWKYAGKFLVNPFKSPIGFFVGIVEIFSELARIISFSFRLFGNIFAGEVLILVVSFFVPYLLPVPVQMFELFVAFVQAAIFTLLTLFFIKLAIAEPHGEAAH